MEWHWAHSLILHCVSRPCAQQNGRGSPIGWTLEPLGNFDIIKVSHINWNPLSWIHNRPIHRVQTPPPPPFLAAFFFFFFFFFFGGGGGGLSACQRGWSCTRIPLHSVWKLTQFFRGKVAESPLPPTPPLQKKKKRSRQNCYNQSIINIFVGWGGMREIGLKYVWQPEVWNPSPNKCKCAQSKKKTQAGNWLIQY